MKKFITLPIILFLFACTTDWEKQIFIDAQKGYTFGVQKALKAGVNPNITNANAITPMHIAAQNGNIYIVRELISVGGTIDIQNSKGQTPLILAAAAGKIKTVGELIQSKADIHKQDNQGMDPLMYACKNGHRETVQYLLESKADFNKFDNEGMNAAAHAIVNKQSETLGQLLRASLNPNMRLLRKNNVTLLMLAAQKGNFEAVRMLLAESANKNLKDPSGKDALTYALESGNDNTAKLLR